jgi:hypothetical protein
MGRRAVARTPYTLNVTRLSENNENAKPMTDDELNQAWFNLVEYEIATDEELQLVMNINGYKIETLNAVLYARTGYHSWNQYQEEEELDQE